MHSTVFGDVRAERLGTSQSLLEQLHVWSGGETSERAEMQPPLARSGFVRLKQVGMNRSENQVLIISVGREGSGLEHLDLSSHHQQLLSSEPGRDVGGANWQLTHTRTR